MAKQESIDTRLVEWVERYRIIIGAGLVLAILAGAITLSVLSAKPKVVEKPTVDAAAEEEITQLRAQNDLLRKQIEEINQARVAGATTKAPSAKSSTSAKATADKQTVSRLININTADQKTLESLPKIGPVTAQKIIDYRNTNGSFKTIAEIKNVKGIGDKTFEQIRDKIIVE